MEKLLIFIKHHLSFLWKIIEFGNGLLFSLLFKKKLARVLQGVFKEQADQACEYRKLELSDTEALHKLLESQTESDLKYFSPHAFNSDALRKQFANRAFLMMGAFANERLIGYFFLRFFANRKCFVGRLIDADSRGKGIGQIMNNIMYETAWRLGFRCLSTISNNNKAVIGAHAKNPAMVVLKELPNEYLLVEFVRTKQTEK